MSVISVKMNSASTGRSRQEDLRSACNALVGMAMFAPMLKEARESSLNSDMFKSSGTRMWQSQFDEVLIENMSERNNSLGDVLYKRFSKLVGAQAAAADKAAKLDIKG